MSQSQDFLAGKRIGHRLKVRLAFYGGIMLKEFESTPTASFINKIFRAGNKLNTSSLLAYIMLAFFCLSLLPMNVFALDNPPEVSAVSAILMEARRGQILYEKEVDRKLHISIANKIMTALLVVENGNLDSDVTISKEAASTEGSLLWLKVGEKYNVRQLVCAILITSANDAAQALAEHVGGSTKKFTEMMNNKAKELGLQNTHFENPTGLLDENQYTTARDLAVLVRYAISNPTFSSMFAYRGMTWIDGANYDYFINGNEMFQRYEPTEGGKIGFNDPSKHSIVTTARKSNQRLICIVLDTPPGKLYDDSIKILEYGFNNYTSDILVFNGQAVNKTLKIGDTEVNLVSNSDVIYSRPTDDFIDLIKSISFNIPEHISPPVTKSTVVGTANYILFDGTVINVPLYPDRDVPLPKTASSLFINKLTENKELLYLLLILLGIEGLLILFNILRAVKKLFTRNRQQIKG